MTHTSTEQERAEFEEWAKTVGLNLALAGHGLYAHVEAQAAWMAWTQQAARRAQVVPQAMADGFIADGFIAGFICAGGDVEEAKNQSVQFLSCINSTAPQPTEADSNPAEFDGIKTEAAPVQMPEPWGHCVGGNVFVSRNLPAHIKPMVDSGEFKDIKLYTEEQVRQLLAAHGIQEQST